ncbi:MAG: CDP-alcohol phosphatidyltransferase family protein [Oceanicaulis sp.]
MHHLPNAISIARALAGPLGAFLLIMSAMSAGEGDIDAANGYGVASAIIFVLAAASDWLDGWAARRLNVVSPLGALLDPIADKLLVGPYLIAYVVIFGFELWLALPVVVIVLRDLVVTGLRLRSGAPQTLAVSYDAKIKTAVQMVITALPLVAVPVLIAMDASQVFFDNAVIFWIGGVWFLAVLTVYTALPYWRAARSR